MQQRVRRPHRGTFPSSSGQLPVPVALNAGSPTLFRDMILQKERNVNTYLLFFIELQHKGRTSGPPLSYYFRSCPAKNRFMGT